MKIKLHEKNKKVFGSIHFYAEQGNSYMCKFCNSIIFKKYIYADR